MAATYTDGIGLVRCSACLRQFGAYLDDYGRHICPLSPKGYEPMAKKSSRAKAIPHRVNTHRTNGSASTSRQVAPPGGRAKRPRQADLPGTEDRAIRALENAANEYADIRDQRMELSRQEHPLKEKLLKLMKHHGKQAYRRDGISIEIVTTQETVKVKIKKPGDEDEDDEQGDVDIEASGTDVEVEGSADDDVESPDDSNVPAEAET